MDYNNRKKMISLFIQNDVFAISFGYHLTMKQKYAIISAWLALANYQWLKIGCRCTIFPLVSDS